MGYGSTIHETVSGRLVKQIEKIQVCNLMVKYSEMCLKVKLVYCTLAHLSVAALVSFFERV